MPQQPSPRAGGGHVAQVGWNGATLEENGTVAIAIKNLGVGKAAFGQLIEERLQLFDADLASMVLKNTLDTTFSQPKSQTRLSLSP